MSSDFVPFPPQKVQEELYLVGFRLDPHAEGPELFTLIASGGENDRPLVSKGRVLFFRRPEDAARALAKSDNDMRGLGKPPKDLALFCDVAEVLHLVNGKDEDPDGIILECIGCFDDLVRAARVNVPAEYMSLLSAISEHLLESNQFGSFIAEKGLDREKFEDALMWCIGAIAVKSTIV